MLQREPIYYNGSSLSNQGNYGATWLSSLNTNNSRFAWYINISSTTNYMGNNGRRYYGLTVRPVRSAE